MATAVSQGATGNAYIDGVLSGVKWSGTVTYSFPDSAADYPGGYGSGEQFNDFAQISAQQQTAVHSIMQQIGNYTNLTITYAGTDGADIRMAHSDDANPTAYAYYPSNASEGEGGDVWFGDGYTNPVVGNYQYATHIHELGHAFGLKHGHETGGPGNIAIPADRDALEYTVMTYRSYLNGPITGYTNEQWGYPQTFMMSDIAALQTMYGADYTYNSGNTVYSWIPGSGVTSVNGAAAITPGGNRIFMTIWDGGGIDTYNFAAYSTGVTINLSPGEYSIASQAQLANLGNGNFAHGNVYNAYLFQGDARSYIENAIGGSGNDTLIGNNVANVLTGNGGNDTMNGGLGVDTMIGGIGDDIYFVDNASDNVTENSGQGYETVWTSVNYTLSGNIEDLALLGSANLTGTGNALNNQLWGNSGVDTLVGGLGNDSYIVHNSATQVVEQAGQGTDVVYADVNFTLASNVEELAFLGSANLTGTGNALDNRLWGNSGADTLIGGLGNDSYIVHNSATQIVEQAGEGEERVFADVNFTLAGNVEILALLGSANLTGTGNALDNQLWSNSGVNTLIGGLGNDAYIVHNSADQVVEQAGQGTDIVFADVNITLSNNVESLALFGSANLTGTGNSLDNQLWGNSGVNTLTGGLGNNSYIVHNSATQVVEQAGQGIDIVFADTSFTLANNVENFQLLGSANLNGTGNAVNNTIYGNSGNNVLTGAGGSNSFVVQPSFGKDTITDFDVLTEHIYFDQTLFTDADDVLANTVDNAQNYAVITYDVNNTLTLVGVSTADLQAHPEDFMFV